MTFIKNIMVLSCIVIGVPCAYALFTETAELRTIFAVMTAVLAYSGVYQAWNLTDRNKRGLVLVTIVWSLMVVIGNEAQKAEATATTAPAAVSSSDGV